MNITFNPSANKPANKNLSFGTKLNQEVGLKIKQEIDEGFIGNNNLKNIENVRGFKQGEENEPTLSIVQESPYKDYYTYCLTLGDYGFERDGFPVHGWTNFPTLEQVKTVYEQHLLPAKLESDKKQAIKDGF